MSTNVEKIRQRLKEAKAMLKEEKGVKGCCRISFNGSVTNRSGITESACQTITDDFPGATYTFHAGASCSEI